MCGYLLYYGHLEDQDNFIEASRSISHRGPDSSKHYFDKKNKINIGFHRLQIMDKDYGEQPFFSKSKNIIILFNGEIYNSKDIRKNLESKGYSFKSINSDTETVLISYIEWGENMCQKFDGMFAITVIDIKRNIIICSRDVFGEKPLYYYIDSKKIIIGSEIRVFRKFLDLTISEKQLMRYFVLSHIPAPNTIYNNVYKIQNSSYIKINLIDNSFKKNIYYDFSNNINNYNNTKFSLSEFDHILKNTVKSRTVSDVKIGNFLSGGIDSTLLAIYLNESNVETTSYTVGIEGKSFDESEKAKDISRFLNIENKNFLLNKNNFSVYRDEGHNMIDEPFFAPSFLPTYALSKFASKDVKVVISGDGGDELFGGYEMFKFASIFNKINLSFNSNKLNNIFNLLPISKNNLSFDFKLRRFLRGLSVDTNLRTTFFLSSIDFSDLQEIFNKKVILQELFEDIYEFNRNYAGLDSYNKMVLYYLKFYLPDLVASRADKAGMYNSLEIRSPFLSKSIFEYHCKISNNYKNSIFSTKKLLKNLIKNKLKNNFKLKKTGLTFPMQSWIKIDDLKLNNFKNLNLNQKKINQMIASHKNKKLEYRNFLMQLDQLSRFNKR